MSGSAKTLSPRAIRWILIAAAVLALLGPVAAPAQAGDFYGAPGIAGSVLGLLGSVLSPAQAGDFDGPSRYNYDPSGYNYDRSGYNNDPDRYDHRCSSCGCWRCGCGGCQSRVRSGGVFERRYRYRLVEREYIERRYTSPVRHYPRYGYAPSRYSYPGYRSRSTQFPWGYGGVRGQQPSYGYGRSAYYRPRPPAPVGYDAGPYGDEGRRWDPE